MMANFHPCTASRGFTLIEVLITIVILSVGLLGLALMQMTSLSNQLESYQRAQAMLLLEDMANRIRVNAAEAKGAGYPTDADLGLEEAGCDPDPPVDSAEIAALDVCQWNNALVGTGVVRGVKNLGSLVGATGCIDKFPLGVDGDLIIRLSIAWQGASATVVPNSDCGKDAFGADDRLRRVASIDVALGDLAL